MKGGCGNRRRKRENERKKYRYPATSNSRNTRNFFSFEPDSHEDERGSDGGAKRLEKGEKRLSTSLQFFWKRVPDTWPAYEGQNGGGENGTFYGFIMRMVDRRGSQTDEETCNTWLPLSWSHAYRRGGMCAQGGDRSSAVHYETG